MLTNKKSYKVTFADQVTELPVAEIFEVESYKMYYVQERAEYALQK